MRVSELLGLGFEAGIKYRFWRHLISHSGWDGGILFGLKAVSYRSSFKGKKQKKTDRRGKGQVSNR